MIGMQLPMLEMKWTTNRLFQAFNVSLDGSGKDVTHSSQYEACTLLLRKGPHFRQWLQLCASVFESDPWLITDRYNEESARLNPLFKENRHDQSIMSVARKLLGCVVINGSETKGQRPDMPFHVMRLKTPVEEETPEAGDVILTQTQAPLSLPPSPSSTGSGPRLCAANSSSVNDATTACSNAGNRSLCPLGAYCVMGRPSGRVPAVEGNMWAPVATNAQQFWVAIGSVYPCMQSGHLDNVVLHRPSYILCCEGRGIDNVANMSTINQRNQNWNQTISLNHTDACIEDILSKNTLPVDLPLINPALGFDAVFVIHVSKQEDPKHVSYLLRK